MKLIWLMPLILMGSMAGQQTTQCCTDKEPVSKVTALSQCEKDKLKAAKAKLAAVQEEILKAHGEPSQLSYFHCGNNSWESFDILNDAFVVEVTNTQYYPCSGATITGGIN
jgi:hypothetical protein